LAFANNSEGETLNSEPHLFSEPPGSRRSEAVRITRAAGVVGAATLISRILGYVRDMVVASVFGAGFVSDAFFVAFSIPNLLRRLFSEGSLSIGFVPVYTDYLNNHGAGEANRLAVSSFRLLFLLLSMSCVAGVLAAPAIVHGLAFGWSANPEKFLLCVRLTRLMMPYIVFIGLAALCMGVLNVLGHFAAPALAPVFLNVAMISAAVGASFFTPDPIILVQWLAVGVCIGGVLQLALQIPSLIRRKICFWRTGPLWHPGLAKIGRLMLPVLLGTGAYQINSVVIKFFASLLPQGSVSCLYYADRLVQFPIGIFGMAAATAVLPALARHATLEQWNELKQTFAYTMRLVFFVTLPAMVGLIVLRKPIVVLLFQRGAFDIQATQLTADALLYYGIGLWAVATVRIVLNTFYACQEVWTPVRIGVLCVAANVLFSLVLMGPMQQNGLALALSLASVMNFVLLVVALRRRLGALGWRPMALSAGRSLLCALIMGVVVHWTARSMLPFPETAALSRLLIGLLVCIMVGVALFGVVAFLLRLPELQTMLRLAVKR
jgi:putative peptidoglycan lipid II flippase